MKTSSAIGLAFVITAAVLLLTIQSVSTQTIQGLTFTKENITTANQNATNNNTKILMEIALQQVGLLDYDPVPNTTTTGNSN